jgi:hypothetical protein
MRVDTLLGVLEQTGVDELCSCKSGSKILNELNVPKLYEINEVEKMAYRMMGRSKFH